jgi:hypothetical protein
MGFNLRSILSLSRRYEQLPAQIMSFAPFVGRESGQIGSTNNNNGRNAYSPNTIFYQIVAIQVFYYITTTILLYLLSILIGVEFKLEWILSWKPISLENTLGLTIIGVWLLGSFFGVIFMTVIVGRSKLAWDFAITVHCINLLVVWAYTREFPKKLLWWAVQIVCCIILVSLGTWTSRWNELRETFFEGMADPSTAGENIEMRDATETV